MAALDFLFGKKVLDKAAGTAEPVKPPPVSNSDDTYMAKQIKKTRLDQEAADKTKTEKASKPAMDKLTKPKPVPGY